MAYVRTSHKRTVALLCEITPKGATRLSSSKWSWDISGRCERPVLIELSGRPAADWLLRHKYVLVKPGTKTTLFVDMSVACRKCQPCIKARMRMWSARAMHEIRNARRTWFATFTLRPEAHYTMQCRAVTLAATRSIPVHEVEGADLMDRAEREVRKELTLFLKRVRKETGSNSLRYLLVRENHKSGLPHYHALLHESGEDAIKYATLKSQWKLGFSKFKLLEDERAAFYVVKYLGKANDGRVRASIRYGRSETSLEIAPQIQGRVMEMDTSEAT